MPEIRILNVVPTSYEFTNILKNGEEIFNMDPIIGIYNNDFCI